MANYINTYSDMAAYNADSTKQYPNVSYVIATDEVVWMESAPIVPKAIYNVTSTSSATKLLNTATGITKQIIDGIEQSSVVTDYTFNTTGEHVVEYEYANNEISDSTFRYCENLTSITIPNSVTTIGKSAFYNCSSLANVTIGNSVTSIGQHVFRDCKSLTNVTIGNSVTKIGGSAFQDCSSLTSINIPNSVTSIGNNAFSNCTSLPVVDNIRYADTCAVLAVDKTLSTYTIKEGTRFIGQYAFYQCTNLTSVTIPNSVTSIGDNAFRNCTNLTSITIPNSVETIGDYAFSNCEVLVDATIGNSVTKIGGWAFQDCSSLTSINIPNSVTSISGHAFSGCVSLPVENNVRYADTCAFGVVDNTLSTYTLKEGTKFIVDAFSYCRNLTSITIPNSVISISGHAFDYCTNLTSITIPDSVTYIDSFAFQSCSSLANVTIPNSVTSIGESAFKYCSSLASVTVYASTPPTLGATVFDNNASGRKIYVPSASVNTYKTATNWSTYASDIEAIQNS